MSAIPSAGELAAYVVYLAAVGGILLGLWKLLARFMEGTAVRIAVGIVGVILLLMGLLVTVDLELTRPLNTTSNYVHRPVQVGLSRGWVQPWIESNRLESEENDERERLHEFLVACLAGGGDWHGPGERYSVSRFPRVAAGPDGVCTHR